MKLDLQTQDLTTGNTEPKAFESEDEAFAWLKDRPKNIAVLGVASHHVSREISDRLKEAMRPLDEEEQALNKKLEEAAEAAARERIQAEQEVARKAAEQHRKSMATADPNREMEIRWTYNSEMCLTDQADTREISAEARAAVLAWVDERQEWVRGRGQMVGDATVKVWPGPLPEGTTERVIRGAFIPVTAGSADS